MPNFHGIEIQSIPEMAFESLVEVIRDFQTGLTDAMEVGITAVGGSLIHVESVRLSGQMIVFDGVDGEERDARLIQHYTQVSVQMIAVDKLQAKARRIGF